MSYTLASENTQLGHEIRKQDQRAMDQKLSGEQHPYQMQNAQDILKNLQVVLQGDEVPGTEFMNSVLFKAEEFLLKQAQTSQVDPETRKSLEDIAQLIGATKQMARNKDLGDRLQRIADETNKAMSEVNRPGVSSKSRDATLEVVRVVDNWRPIFQLLCSSREFRGSILDASKILRRVLLQNKREGLGDRLQDKFIQGETPKELIRTAKEETRQQVNENQYTGTNGLTDEEFDVLYEDMAHVLMTIARNPSYKDGVERLFNLIGFVQHQISSTTDHVKNSDNVRPHARRAQLETQELITSFTGVEALEDFIDSMRRLVEKVNREQKSRQYLTQLRNFILDTKSAEMMSEQETKERLRKLSREGREIVEEYRYADEIDDFLYRFDILMDNIKNDEFVAVLRHHAGLVADDLSYVDNNGNVKMDTDMLSNLRGVITPIIAESLKYIPIPRIEDHDSSREFWVDNVVLCGYDIIPENIRFQLETDNDLNIRDIKTDKSKTRLILTLNNIKTEIKDIDFYYHKKTFPHITEHGKVTISLPGKGATLIVTYFMEQAEGKAPMFNSGSVDFQIHNFDVSFDKKTLNHSVLVPMLTGLFKKQIQRRIELAVEKNLGELVNGIGMRLTNALVDVNRPLSVSMDRVRNAVKATDMGNVNERRKEILE